MPSFKNPKVTNPINSDVSEISELLKIVAKQDYTGATDLPEGAKRLADVSGGVQFQKYANSSWSSIGKLMHDVDQLDGHHASTTAVKNTIPVYNANAQLVGSITGNAATATKLASKRTIDIGGIATADAVGFDGSGNITIPINSINVANDDDNALVGIVSKAHGGTGRNDGAATDVILSNGGKASEYGQIGEAKNITGVDIDTLIEPGDYISAGISVENHWPYSNSSTYGRVKVSRISGNKIIQILFCGTDSIWQRLSVNGGASWSALLPSGGNRGSSLTLYISKSGNDLNTGTDSAHPVLTINRALKIAEGWKPTQSTAYVIFRIGEGNWGDLTLSGLPYTLLITDYSNSNTNTYSETYPVFNNITLRNCYAMIRNSVITTIQATYGGCIYLDRYIRTSSVISNNFSYVSVASTNTEIINAENHRYVFNANYHSAIAILSTTIVTVIENITLPDGFILLSHGSTMTIKRDNPFTVAEGVTVTGRKYTLHKATDLWVYGNAGTVIETFPGNTPGVIDVGARVNGIPYGGGDSDAALMGDRTWKPVLLQTGGEITGKLTITGDDDVLKLRNSRYSIDDESIDSDIYSNLYFLDKNNQFAGVVQCAKGVAGNSSVSLITRSKSTNNFAAISLQQDANGNAVVYCPTPPDSANSMEIITAAWANKNIGSKLAGYLPLTGGNLTGPLTFSNLAYISEELGDVHAINFGTALGGTQGPILTLRLPDAKETPGAFYLGARTQGVAKYLIGLTDGGLWWDGKQIVRSVNGATADSTGNVTVSNINTATKLKTARKITVQHYIAGHNGGFGMKPNYTGAGSASFDGSGNITIRVPTGNYDANCNCDCS